MSSAFINKHKEYIVDQYVKMNKRVRMKLLKILKLTQTRYVEPLNTLGVNS